MQHVFIVGSKGIPGAYGGYETFVDKLTEYHQNLPEIKYHVACKSREKGQFQYHNARCFKVTVPNIGSAQAIWYDVAALSDCCRYIRENHIDHPIVYILACRIGPFAAWFQREIHKLGGVVYTNPDGHEYLRAKWPLPVRKYWKISEQMMVKHSDLLVCDSRNIEKYIQDSYRSYHPKTTFIAYGAEIRPSALADDDEKVTAWFQEKGLREKEYYLMVGRFVPENNFETIIREFMKSSSRKNLAIITTTNERFMKELDKRLRFTKDARIRFVGTVYDQELLKKIREKAFGYLHGHEVGGTNPSLLEAMGSTDLNLLLDVGFNQEVGEDGAVYWGKREGELVKLIEKMDYIEENEKRELRDRARRRVKEHYSWEYIAKQYRELFLSDRDDSP